MVERSGADAEHSEGKVRSLRSRVRSGAPSNRPDVGAAFVLGAESGPATEALCGRSAGRTFGIDKTRGLSQPIVVRRTSDGYSPVAVSDASARPRSRVSTAFRRSFARATTTSRSRSSRNLQREDLSPLEEAEALAFADRAPWIHHREVADLLGKSRP